MTIDGRLFTSLTSDTALLDPSVVMDIRIYNPAASCILYEEKQTVDTSSTDGRFTILVGSAVGASKRVTGEPGNSMAAIFQNNAPMAGSCGTYAPAAGDARLIRIVIAPSTTGTIETLAPDTIIDSVPNALVAETLQGLAPSNFVETDSASLTQANIANIFSNANYPLLTALLGGTSTSYVNSSVNGATIPSVAGVPATLAQGQIWFNSSANSFQYYNGSAVQTLGISGSGISAVTVGSSLTANGAAGGTLNSSGTIDLVNSGVSAGTYPKVTVNSKGLVTYGTGLSESDIPTLLTPGHVVGDAIISGTIGGSTAFYSSGNVTTTGTVQGAYLTSTYDLTRKLSIYGTGGTHSISFTAPTMTSDYAVVFPAAAGAAGTTLMNDGSGNLSWVSSAAGSVTSVGLALPSIFSVTTPVVTSTGTLTAALANENANLVFAGPASGGAAAPTFRGLAVADLPAGYDASVLKTSLAAGKIWIGSTGGVATAITPFGDVNLSIAGSATVTQLQGSPVNVIAPSLAGQVLRWDGSQWTPNFVAMTDLRSKITGTTFFANTCAANQTLTFSSVTDSMACSNISIASTQVTWASTGANLVFAGPATGGSASPTFRPLTAADLPSGTTSQWNTVSATINYLAGFVGIGTAAPQTVLDVYGTGAASAMLIPRDSVSARPTGINGMLRYNTTTNAVETFANGAWSSVATAASGASQWITNAPNIYYGSGSVGIGTSAPAYAFDIYNNAPVDIASRIYSTSSGQNAMQILQTDSTVFQLIAKRTSFGGGGNVNVFTGQPLYLSTTNSPRVTIAAGGNVAIGNFSPVAGLDIQDPVTSSSGVAYGTRALQTLTASANGDALDGLFINPTFTDGGFSGVTHNGLIVANGNVGIGTQTPAALLDVYGTGSASAILLPRDTTTNRPAGINGMIRYNTSNAQLETYSSGAWAGVATSTAVSGSYLPLTGGTLTGAVKFPVGSAAAPSLNFGDLTTGLFASGSGNVSLATYGTARVSVTSAGNVGIGSTSPSAMLQISNASNAGANFEKLGDHTSSIYEDGDFHIEANTRKLWLNGNSSSTTIINNGGGNVGIGTYLPAYTLDIINPTANSNSPMLRLGNPGGGAGNTVGLILTPYTGRTGGPSSQILAIDDGNSSAHLAFLTAPSGSATAPLERLRITDAGALGIGTGTPAALLDVYATGLASAIVVPRDTTTNRPTSGVNGMIRYNTTVGQLETYTSGAWNGVATSAAGGGASQWTTSAANIYYNSTGNVGIGSTAPVYTLDVAGNVGANGSLLVGRYDSTSEGGRIYSRRASDNTLGWYMQTYGTGSTPTFRIVDASAAAQRATFDGNGNLGIGKTAPAARLHLAGPSEANAVTDAGAKTAALRLDTTDLASGSGGSVEFGAYGKYFGAVKGVVSDLTTNSLGDIAFYTRNGITDGFLTERLRIQRTGLVGIGTSNPAALLHVGIDSSTRTAGVQLGTNYRSYLYDAASTNTLVLDSNGDTDYRAAAGTNNGHGEIALMTGAGTSYGGPNTSVERLRINGYGNVGIGTSVPAAILDVYGSGTNTAIIVPRDTTANRPSGVNGMIRYNTTLSQLETYSSGVWGGLTSGASASAVSSGVTGAVQFSNGSGGFNASASNFFWDNTNNRLGIGTSSPVSALDTGGGDITGSRFFPKGGSVNYPSYAFNVGGAGNTMGMFFIAQDVLGFSTNQTERMRFDASGNLGIGTSSPAASVDINGATLLRGGLLSYTNAAATWPAYDPVAAHTSFAITDNVTNGNAEVDFINTSSYAGGFRFYQMTGSGSGNIMMTISGSGNVGIGTSAPVYPLDVAGHVRTGPSSAQIILGGSLPSSTSGLWLDYGNVYSTTATIQAETQGTAYRNLLLEPLGGMLGIGTSAPNGTLQISTPGVDNTDGLVIYQQSNNTQTLQTYLDGHWSDRTSYNGGNAGYLALQPDGGVVGIGTITPGYPLDVKGTVRVGSQALTPVNGVALAVIHTGSGTQYGIEIRPTTAGGTTPLVMTNSAGSVQGSISNNGTGTTNYNTTSDHRLKENIVPLTGALTRLENLEPKRFDYIADPSHRTMDGFIAHEVQSVIPEAVTGAKDAVDSSGKPVYQQLDLSKIVPLITAALRELAQHVFAMEATLASKADKADVVAKTIELEAINAKLERENSLMKAQLEKDKAMAKYLCEKDPSAPFCR